MGIEATFEFPDDLDETLPLTTDSRREGDDHIRGIKKTIKDTLVNCDGNPIGAPLINLLFPPNGGSVFVLRNGGVPVSPATFLGGTWNQGSYITLNDGTIADLWIRNET